MRASGPEIFLGTIPGTGQNRRLAGSMIGHDLPVAANDGRRPVAPVRKYDRIHNLSTQKTPPPTKIQRT
ncbi:MAG: hypothetical protein ACP5OP_03115 [Leptospirillia bacterium]